MALDTRRFRIKDGLGFNSQWQMKNNKEVIIKDSVFLEAIKELILGNFDESLVEVINKESKDVSDCISIIDLILNISKKLENNTYTRNTSDSLFFALKYINNKKVLPKYLESNAKEKYLTEEYLKLSEDLSMYFENEEYLNFKLILQLLIFEIRGLIFIKESDAYEEDRLVKAKGLVDNFDNTNLYRDENTGETFNVVYKDSRIIRLSSINKFNIVDIDISSNEDIIKLLDYVLIEGKYCRQKFFMSNENIRKIIRDDSIKAGDEISDVISSIELIIHLMNFKSARIIDQVSRLMPNDRTENGLNLVNSIGDIMIIKRQGVSINWNGEYINKSKDDRLNMNQFVNTYNNYNQYNPNSNLYTNQVNISDFIEFFIRETELSPIKLFEKFINKMK